MKAGDEIYVCGCGKGCDCYTVSKREGKCTCSQDLVKVKVDKVEKGKAFFKQEGKEASVPLTGKYMCACGSQCDCKTISQKPGKPGLLTYPPIKRSGAVKKEWGRRGYNSSGVKATTSSMDGASRRSMTRRSMPRAIPAEGGMVVRSSRKGWGKG